MNSSSFVRPSEFDTPELRSRITPALPGRAARRLTSRRAVEHIFPRTCTPAADFDHRDKVAAACARHGYELIMPAGNGGMGAVWLARDGSATASARVVAIKAMLPKVADDPHFRAMFLDEGHIASRIASPHVARVFALHEDDGVLFQVMEWVDGESLLQLHNAATTRGDRMPLAAVLRALADACDGLHAAHELRGDDGRPLLVVHRDVSPSNILVGPTGEVKLVDFGIAKARARIAESTIGFGIKGRIHYVAPEYAAGYSPDRRTDTWSMGATLYFLLCGRAPFAASNETAVLFKLMSGEPIPPLPATVPPDVVAIAHRALERDPAQRYATAGEMRDALAEAAERHDPRGGRELLSRFVVANESEDVRERRRSASADKEADRVTLPEGAVSATSPGAAGSRKRRVALGIAATLIAFAVSVGWRATAVEERVSSPQRVAEVIEAMGAPASRAIDIDDGAAVTETIVPAIETTPARASAPVSTHAPAPRSHGARARPAPSPPPPAPARRHYGF
jgi:serine/threonine-protein kinase